MDNLAAIRASIPHRRNTRAYSGSHSSHVQVSNPATGEVTGQVTLSSVERTRTVIDAPAATFTTWRDGLQQKPITSRWPGPSHGGINLGVPENR